MNELKIHIRNCYGIGSLDKEIDLSNGCCIIYAPNGTMKSSLTHVFQDIAARKESEDRIFTERVTERKITIDGTELDPASIFVFQNEEADGQKSVSSFLTNPELKKRYDSIHKELADAKKTLITSIKNTSGSSDIESEILGTFQNHDTNNVYDCFLALRELVDGESIPVYSFKYNEVFDKNGKVKEFLSKNNEVVLQYFKKYQVLLANSQFFSSGVDSFGTSQADALVASVKDDRFFKASHKFVLKDGTEMHDKESLVSRVEKEVSAIYNNDELKSIYTSLEKKLSKNADLQKFKEAIKNNPAMINKLVDYEKLRKEVIVSYLQHHKESFDAICDLYSTKKEELRKIIQDANSYTDRWESIIDLFNARFFVPFEANIKNLPDVLLNEKTAALSFFYKDEDNTQAKELIDVKSIKLLSQGEIRAYNIMQNLFVIEGLKEDGKEHLIVMDDIADSFDYKNKYAILEYMHDILQFGKFKLIILTHNFDFYRTAVSRLKIKSQFFAYKKENREIALGQGIFRQDILKARIINKAYNNDAAFISLIPFVRNIIEYAKGASSDEYKLLTTCLHDKPNTEALTKGQLIECMQEHICGLKGKSWTDTEVQYTEILQKATSNALKDSNEIEITNKIVLSISIRILTEKYIKSCFTPEQLGTFRLNEDQTGNLCEEFKKQFSETKPKECLLVNKVLMLTSENIHLNNFMFEPIVDMPIAHIKALYEEVKVLFWVNLMTIYFSILLTKK